MSDINPINPTNHVTWPKPKQLDECLKETPELHMKQYIHCQCSYLINLVQQREVMPNANFYHCYNCGLTYPR